MTSMPHRAVRTVVILLFSNVGMSLLLALLALAFRHNVIAYQLARHPGTDQAALAYALWVKPASVAFVTVVYAWVARRLLRGDPRGYRRVRAVSAAGFLSVLWLLLNAEYPSWLLIGVGLQLLLRAALLVAVFRPGLRDVFAAQPSKPAPGSPGGHKTVTYGPQGSDYRGHHGPVDLIG